MNDKLILYKEYTKQWINSSNFKMIVLILICINLYGTLYLSHNTDYISCIFNCFSNVYYTYSFLFIVLISTLISVQLFDKNLFYIIRFRNKKEYLYQLICKTWISNTILFVVNCLLVIIGLNLFAGTSFAIYEFQSYGINNLIYLIFFLIRIYLIIQLIGMINVLLLKLVPSKLSVILANISVALPSFFHIIVLNKNIQGINQMYLYFIDYFTIHNYSSFSLEVLCSTIYILIMILICVILFNITKMYMKKIGE